MLSVQDCTAKQPTRRSQQQQAAVTTLAPAPCCTHTPVTHPFFLVPCVAGCTQMQSTCQRTHTRTSFAASIAFTLSVYSNTSSISALCSPVPPPQMRQHTHASSCHPPSPCPQTSEREMARKELAAGDDHSALAAASEEVRGCVSQCFTHSAGAV